MEIMKNCPNCGHPLSEDATFCPVCGQKQYDRLPTVGEVLREFFSSLFNFEYLIFPSLRDLFIPGRLSQAFVDGKRKSFVSPIRFFLISILVLLAVANFAIRQEGIEINEGDFREKVMRQQSGEHFMESFDSLRQRLDTTFAGQDLQQPLDSLRHWMEQQGPEEVLSSVSFGLNSHEGLQFETYEETDSLYDDSSNIKLVDLYTLTPDSVIEKYNIEGFWYRMGIRQLAKVMQENKRLVPFFVEKLVWMSLLLLPLFALWLKLLYVRRKRFYIEHLIFLFHTHTSGFLLLSVLLLLENAIQDQIFNLWAISLYFGGLALYVLIAMRRFYRQGWFKTLIKFLLSGLVYFLLLLIMLLISVVVSFFLF